MHQNTSIPTNLDMSPRNLAHNTKPFRPSLGIRLIHFETRSTHKPRILRLSVNPIKERVRVHSIRTPSRDGDRLYICTAYMRENWALASRQRVSVDRRENRGTHPRACARPRGAPCSGVPRRPPHCPLPCPYPYPNRHPWQGRRLAFEEVA